MHDPLHEMAPHFVALATRVGGSLMRVYRDTRFSKNKLPYKTHEVTYELEYGTNELHIHEDALRPGDRVLLVDDLLATGGTLAAAATLAAELEAEIVAAVVVVELTGLNGRAALGDIPVESLVRYG